MNNHNDSFLSTDDTAAMCFAGCIFHEDRAAGAGMVDLPAAGLECHCAGEKENPLARGAWMPIPNPTGGQPGETAADRRCNGGNVQCGRRWRIVGCGEFNLPVWVEPSPYYHSESIRISESTPKRFANPRICGDSPGVA